MQVIYKLNTELPNLLELPKLGAARRLAALAYPVAILLAHRVPVPEPL